MHMSPVIQMDNWRRNSAICPHLQSKGGPRSKSGPGSEFDFTGRASSRPAQWEGWGGSWVLRTSWLERLEVGRAKFRESAAVEGPICLLCLVCTPNRADGWSPSSSINSSALPPAPSVLSTAVSRETEVVVGWRDGMRRQGGQR